MKITLQSLQHQPEKQLIEEHGHHRTFEYYTGNLEANGNIIPFEIKVINNGTMSGLLPGMKDKWTASIDLNEPEHYDFQTSATCQNCSGNWGTSDPPTPGEAAKEISNLILPIINKQFPIYKYDRPGGWALFTLYTTKTKSTPKKSRRRFYSATQETINCPICGTHDQIVSEYNG